MKVRLQNLWEHILSSYWFLPGLMAVGSLAIAIATTRIDQTAQLNRPFTLIWGGGASGARNLLSTLAGSMITVAGVTFSITIVVFSQASSQFGPRVLRSFMRDRGNQFVLGTFVATFIYCLMVLRTIRDLDNVDFVPHLSVTICLLLALISLGVLIYFFHHVTLSIQAPQVVANTAQAVFGAIDQLYPAPQGTSSKQVEESEELKKLPEDFDDRAEMVTASTSGYLQAVDNELLMRISKEKGLVIRMGFRPGDFVTQRHKLADVYPGDRLDEEVIESIREALIVGKQRTHNQNLNYSTEQLVEIAVRSLSPSLNDPFTAILCIDWLGAVLSRLAEKEFPSPYRYDDDHQLRLVIARPLNFNSVTDTAFNHIRQNARDMTPIYLHLLQVIARLLPMVEAEAARDNLMLHAQMIYRAGHAHIPEERDLADLDEYFRKVTEAVQKFGS